MKLEVMSRAANWRLGILIATCVANWTPCRAQLEVINGLAHGFKSNQRINGWIEVWNRGEQIETAVLTVRPLVPRNSPAVDSQLVNSLKISRSVTIPAGEKVKIPFHADSVDRGSTSACMVYVEPAWALAYEWDVASDSIGLVAVVRYGVALLAGGGVVSDSLVSVRPERDSTGLWLELSNRSAALWIPRATWSERGLSLQKNEWVLLPGETKRIRWSPVPRQLGRLVVLDDDRRRWQWTL
jgi:hypothetical protein